MKYLGRGVTVAFFIWQVAGLLILLTNLDLVVEVYQTAVLEMQQRLLK